MHDVEENRSRLLRQVGGADRSTSSVGTCEKDRDELMFEILRAVVIVVQGVNTMLEKKNAKKENRRSDNGESSGRSVKGLSVLEACLARQRSHLGGSRPMHVRRCSLQGRFGQKVVAALGQT